MYAFTAENSLLKHEIVQMLRQFKLKWQSKYKN